MTQDGYHTLNFAKMHGLGNDFVVIDARNRAVPLDDGLVARIADRHRGVGFDQLAVIEADDAAAARLTFYNADGSRSDACGNATRCIAARLMAETGADAIVLRTAAGDLQAREDGGMVAVNMGPPRTDWAGVPLSEPLDTLELPIEGAPTATGMGNPHCSFFVPDAEAIPLDRFGPRYETHPLFPERTNVQVVSVTGPDRLRMRVWERGVGITQASGSSSCAVAVAAARRGLTGRQVTVDLDGGALDVAWGEDGVWMRGPTAHVFDGVFTADWLAAP